MKRADFVQMLVLVAQACEFELTEPLIAMYDRALQTNGYEKLVRSLQTIMINRRSRDGFPSIREIQEIIMPVLDSRSIATDASARLVAAVSKFGRMNAKEAEIYVGEVGWNALKIWGSWSQLCEQLTVYNSTQVSAQLRDLCQTVVKKAELGLGNGPISLPKPREELKALTAKVKSL